MAQMAMGQAARSAAEPRGGVRHWLPALPGVLFVATFVAGFMIYQPPDDNASNQTWVNDFATRGHRIAILLSGYLLLIAGMSLIVFLTRLYGRIQAASGGARRDALPLVAAAVAGALIALGGLAAAVIAGGTIFGSVPPTTNADLLRFMQGASFVFPMVGGLVALAVAITVMTLHAQRAGYFGRGLTIFSYIAAAAGVASVMFIPAAIVMLWMLTMSYVIVQRQPVSGT